MRRSARSARSARSGARADRHRASGGETCAASAEGQHRAGRAVRSTDRQPRRPAAAAQDKEQLDKPVKARIKRDATRGRLAGSLLGLFQLKPSDACDERGKLRQGDVVEKISTPNGPTKGIGQFESIEAVRRHIKNLDTEMTLHVARRCNDAAAAAALAAACGGATSSLLASHAGSGSGALLPYEQLQGGRGRERRPAAAGGAAGTTRSSCSCTPSSQWFNPSSWSFMSHRYALCPCVV